MSKYDQYIPALMNLLSMGQVWYEVDISHTLRLPGWNAPSHRGWSAWNTCRRAEQLGLIQRLPKHKGKNCWVKI